MAIQDDSGIKQFNNYTKPHAVQVFKVRSNHADIFYCCIINYYIMYDKRQCSAWLI